MLKKVIWLLVSSLMVLSLVMASCGPQEEEAKVTEEGETIVVTTKGEGKKVEEEEEVAVPSGEANWWDKFGEPQYGGVITLATGSLTPQFDTSDWRYGTTNHHFENLFCGDWTVDRTEWGFVDTAFPQEYAAPWLAESWEWADPQTVIVYIRDGVYWQNKSPVNGRKFTADDVKHHYDRALGIGSGYTEPNPLYISVLGSIEQVTAIDDSTVEFKFNNPSAINIYILLEQGLQNSIEAPEAVEMEGGQLVDWEKAVGTSAWMLTDYVAGASVAYSKNPTYWGYDERHPENKLPYADKLKILVIPDSSTMVAGLRTGTIDILGVGWEQAEELAKTNPELQLSQLPAFGRGLAMRCDTSPFDDIKVRKALQLALDRETIAATYYGGMVDGKPSMVMRSGIQGWTVPYDEWPQELQDEYSYDPGLAKQLLADAGYPNGINTNIIATSALDLDLLQIIVAQFEDIGVNLEIRTMEFAAYMGYLFGGNHDQMYYWYEGGLGFAPSVSILWRHSKMAPSNFTYNNDAGYDALVDKFLAATTEEEAKEIFGEACWYILENHWTVQVFPLVSYMSWQPFLKGYSGEVLDFKYLPFYAARLWIDQDM